MRKSTVKTWEKSIEIECQENLLNYRNYVISIESSSSFELKSLTMFPAVFQTFVFQSLFRDRLYDECFTMLSHTSARENKVGYGENVMNVERDQWQL